MKPIPMRCFFQFFRYGLVGILNTAVFASLCWMGMRLGWHYAGYTALAYAVAILFSYTANLQFTFKTAQHPQNSFFRFIIVCACLVVAVEGIQILLIEMLHINETYAVVLTMILYTLTGFCVNKYWVFEG